MPDDQNPQNPSVPPNNPTPTTDPNMTPPTPIQSEPTPPVGSTQLPDPFVNTNTFAQPNLDQNLTSTFNPSTPTTPLDTLPMSTPAPVQSDPATPTDPMNSFNQNGMHTLDSNPTPTPIESGSIPIEPGPTGADISQSAFAITPPLGDTPSWPQPATSPVELPPVAPMGDPNDPNNPLNTSGSEYQAPLNTPPGQTPTTPNFGSPNPQNFQVTNDQTSPAFPNLNQSVDTNKTDQESLGMPTFPPTLAESGPTTPVETPNSNDTLTDAGGSLPASNVNPPITPSQAGETAPSPLNIPAEPAPTDLSHLSDLAPEQNSPSAPSGVYNPATYIPENLVVQNNATPEHSAENPEDQEQKDKKINIFLIIGLAVVLLLVLVGSIYWFFIRNPAPPSTSLPAESQTQPPLTQPNPALVTKPSAAPTPSTSTSSATTTTDFGSITGSSSPSASPASGTSQLKQQQGR